MRTPSLRFRQIPVLILAWALSACSPGLVGSAGVASGGLQVSPSTTSVGVNQGMSFQATGGTPPYTFQVNGVGSIDSFGNYQAGPVPGQAQIVVTDSNSQIAYATVSVVQLASGSTYGNQYGNQYVNTYGSPYGSYSSTFGSSYGGPAPSPYSSPYTSAYGSPYSSVYSSTGSSQYFSTGLLQRRFSSREMGLLERPGWTVTNSSQLRLDPLVRGQVVAVEDRRLGSSGQSVHMKYLETGLRHPLVRLEELLERRHVVAARAIVEDQFLVKLDTGHSEGDLLAVVRQSGAHISKTLGTGSGTIYLVSLEQGGKSEAGELNASLLSRRTELKQALGQIGEVSPNFVAGEPDTPVPSR